MIISHKHRLIHIHNNKSAGTSFEVALSKYCGENDIITPENEVFRKKLNFLSGRNYKAKGFDLKFEKRNFKRMLINLRSFARLVFYKLGLEKSFEDFFYFYPIIFYPRILFGRHETFNNIQKKLNNELDDYLKITIIRNPVEQFSCFYDYRKGIPQPHDCIKEYYTNQKLSFDAFTYLCSTIFFERIEKLIEFNDAPNVMYIRYEHLYDDIKLLEKKLPALAGLIETLAGIHLKRTGALKVEQAKPEIEQYILEQAKFMEKFYPHLYSPK